MNSVRMFSGSKYNHCFTNLLSKEEMAVEDAAHPDKYIYYENNLAEGGHVRGHNNFICEEFDK